MASQENLSQGHGPFKETLPTHAAAAKNDLSELSKLVKDGAQLVDPDTKETPLHAAAKSGALDALKWILDNKVAALEARSKTGNTAAHLAAVWGHLPCLKHLLTVNSLMGKALSEMGEDGGLTVLSLATLQGDENMAMWLLDTFPNSIHVPNNNSDQVVHFAAAEGQINILKKIVELFGKDLASIEDNRSTRPVFFAAQQGRVEVLDYLINELEVDPLARDNMGMTTIHVAAQNQMFEAIKWLIEKLGKKYVVEKTVDGATPLHLAAASGNVKILKYLLENLEDPADINVTDHINATPAHDAAEYGQAAAMLTLLQHGADITIADTDSKTPYEIALEEGQKGHLEVASMLADFRDNGPSSLPVYEKKIFRNGKERSSQNGQQPRTSRQEAEELSSVIQKRSEIVDKNKEKMLKRQESLNKMNEVGLEEENERAGGDEFQEAQTGSNGKQSNTPPQVEEQEGDIDHTAGPDGDFYAVPKKKKIPPQKPRKGRGRRSHQNSDVDEYMSETMSHHSYGNHYPSPLGSPPIMGGEPAYATVNHETASNYSRPSRVKRYQDTDSEISGLTGRSDYLYDNRPRHVYPGYGPGFIPGMPGMPMPKGPPRPMSSSSKESGSHYGIPNTQFQYNAPMYMGYPPMYQGYPHGGHMMPQGGHVMPQGGHVMPQGGHMMPQGGHVMTQGGHVMTQSGQMMPLPPHGQFMQGYGPNGGMAMFIARPVQMRKYYQAKQEAGRRKSLSKKKKKKQPSIDESPLARKPHTDQNIGYGPSMEGANNNILAMDTSYDDNFHPPAPPITTNKGTDESTEVLKFDSNFIMTKPGEASVVGHHGGTKLNPSKAKPAPYDGRYDKYIMTDSEEEYEVDDQHRVGFAAEVACIIAIGCVAGLKGFSKMKKGGHTSTPKVEQKPPENTSLSTAWDTSYNDVQQKKKGKRSRRNSIAGPEISALSPDEFAGKEETDRTTWNKEGKKKKNKNEEKKKKKPAEAEDVQTGLVTQDLIKMSYQSVSKSLGEKILGDTIGARNSSMVNMMMGAGLGSRMSLASNHDDDNDDDDNFDDTISILHGQNPSKKGKPFGSLLQPGGDEDEPVTSGGEDKPKKKKKEKKDKEKKKKEKKKKDKNKNEDESELLSAQTAQQDDSEGRREAEAVQQEDTVSNSKAKRSDKKEKKKKKKEDSSEVIENSGASSVDAYPGDIVVSMGIEGANVRKEETGSIHSKESISKSSDKNEEREAKEQEIKEKEEKREKERKEREEKKEKERREKEEKKEKEKREREEKKEREKKEREEKKDRERKEKEEKKEKLKKEKEERDKERKEKEEKEREKREKDKKEKEEKNRERKEKEKAEKEERERERKEKEAREREKRELDKKEREDKEKERKEKIKAENDERERQKIEMEEEQRRLKEKEQQEQKEREAQLREEQEAKLKKENKQERERREKKEKRSREEEMQRRREEEAKTQVKPPTSERPLSATSVTSGPSVKERTNNAVYMFDTESDEEDEIAKPAPRQPPAKPSVVEEAPNDYEQTMKDMASDLNDFLSVQASAPVTSSMPTKAAPKKTALPGVGLDSDDLNREIYGDSGLDELNDALAMLQSIAEGFKF